MTANEPGNHRVHDMPGHLIRRLHQISMAMFHERIAALGLDLTAVQYGALSVLAERPGIDQATLAGLIAYDRATIGGVVDRLETKGLISRQVSMRDRRARELNLTRRGARVLARVEPEISDVQGAILASLADGERAEFMRCLKLLTDAGNIQSRAPLVRPEDR